MRQGPSAQHWSASLPSAAVFTDIPDFTRKLAMVSRTISLSSATRTRKGGRAGVSVAVDAIRARILLQRNGRIIRVAP